MSENEKKTVERLQNPTASLRNLGKKRTLEIPRSQKTSMETIKGRIYNETPEKEFRFELVDKSYYTIKRIK